MVPVVPLFSTEHSTVGIHPMFFLRELGQTISCFVIPGPNNTHTCCDPVQMTTFAGSLQLPKQLLSRCPACYKNFLNEICQMTCSPHHSRFIVGDTTAMCPNGRPYPCPGEGWPQVKYYATNMYADGLYNSCKDVQMPSTNGKALSVMCGRKEGCTPLIWLSYMGNINNGHAPFPVMYNLTDQPFNLGNRTINPLNVSNLGCNETHGNDSTCSCQDCAASCAVIPPYPKEAAPWQILGIDGISFIMGCIFAVFVIFFGVYVICYNIIVKDGFDMGGKKSNEMSRETESQMGSSKSLMARNLVSPADIGSLEKLGAKVEQLLTNGFTTWGRLCAANPIIVLLVTIIIFGSLAGGIARYNVTTDPVKLWSADTSTARTQKDYFDSHFGYVSYKSHFGYVLY